MSDQTLSDKSEVIVEIYCPKHGRTKAEVDALGVAHCLKCIEMSGLVLNNVYTELIK